MDSPQTYHLNIHQKEMKKHEINVKIVKNGLIQTLTDTDRVRRYANVRL